MLEWLVELKDNIDRHGIRWGIVLTLYAVYRKEHRNHKLDLRDEAIFHNQKMIMRHMGIEEQWIGTPSISAIAGAKNLKKSLRLSRKVINRGNPLRRRKKMQNINWYTLTLALVGALKLILNSFGIEFPDQQVNEIANGAAAILTIIGVHSTHRKENTDAQRISGDGPAV
jgi:uncharacterized membrane protein